MLPATVAIGPYLTAMQYVIC